VKARASFRSQLAVGSVLWTLGLLFVISVLLIHLLGANPEPHMLVYRVFASIDMVVVLALGGAAMMTGAWQIRRSLRAMTLLHTRLNAMHRGEDRQLGGLYPSEVQPLVDDLNALLAEREARVQRALAKAGDLAHGLKTPLAVLARDADRATASGDLELASSMTAQVERMRRQIDYHLAHARAAAGNVPGMRSLVAPSVDALFRTLERLHAERAIAMRSEVGPAHAVRCQREDLEEMLGNLLDNACKWGKSRVYLTATIETLQASSQRKQLRIAVEDDGPGLSVEQRAKIGKRGMRLDETKPGSGLGLSIVSDLAASYRGRLTLEASEHGGLKAVLGLPAA